MKASEFITEAVTNPYTFDYNNFVRYQTDNKRKKQGITGRFKTDKGGEYLVKGLYNGPTKKERDEEIAYRAAVKRREEKGQDGIFLPPMGLDVQGGIWEIHFDKVEHDEELDPFQNNPAYKSDLTKSGDEFRVFATVLAIMQRTINEFKPEIISIKSANTEPKRASLYKRLADRFASKAGYKVAKSTVTGDKTRMELRKIDTK